MAKKKQSNNNKNSKTTNRNTKEFQSPTETWWGKLVIWALIFGTVLIVLISVVIAIVQSFN